jgi:hypothetical protein
LEIVVVKERETMRNTYLLLRLLAEAGVEDRLAVGEVAKLSEGLLGDCQTATSVSEEVHD